MRKLTLNQEKQQDGTINHVSGVGCPLEPCATLSKESMHVETCDNLKTKFNSMIEELEWFCKKESCLSGVDE